jgi:rare lipoprotein A
MRDDDRCSIKGDGDVILSFDPYAGQADNDTEDDQKRFGRAFEMATRVANALRIAFGVTPVNLDIADKPMSRLEMLGKQFTGAASWYGGRFNGRRCSDGSRFSEARLTAAHRSLPFGTKVLVKNRKTGDTCVVEVNDRGPFIDGRVIDVSKAAAKQLNMVSAGIASVECTVLQ